MKNLILVIKTNIFKILFLFFCFSQFFALYFNNLVNIFNIKYQPNPIKIKLFLFTFNLFQTWKTLFIAYPILFILKKWANNHNSYLIILCSNENIASFLMKKKIIDGYIYSPSFNSLTKYFWKINEISLVLKIKKIYEKRNFFSLNSFLSFFLENYLIIKFEWIGKFVFNKFFLWLAKIASKEYKLYFYLQKNSILQNIWIKLILNFFSIPKVNFWFIQNNYYYICEKVAKKYKKNFKYKPCDLNWNFSTFKLLSNNKTLTNKFRNKKQYYVIALDYENDFTIWPYNNLSKLIDLISDKWNIFPIFLINSKIETNKKIIKYTKKVRSNVSLKNRNKIITLNFSIINDWAEIKMILKLSKFVITYDNFYLPLSYLLNCNILLIAGNINVNTYFPIQKEYCSKKQKLLWVYSSTYKNKQINNKFWINQKINKILLQLLSSKAIFKIIVEFFKF